DTVPISQVVVRGVDGIEFLAVDAAGNEHSFWPLLGELADVEQNPDGRLVAIKVHMAVDPYGELTRLWVVPFASAPETVEDEQGESA
ncbi:MAG: hypothetical protein O7H39_18175, partial [Gammaproteobacteria bacterium]|nr:hypothetical protein [Gammaproteobacteria bacterium]